ncbi:hypothetical protein BHE90_000560 [Fusarium euwallaceae]|uniref:ATPase AAA-type core domain-containing protein n=1 Tax=Fusarium euwallaceae TaxID=1147111 RepID=A0A430MAA9_9HYPO|nr:hypothetical protein BHE90_000560 [Fusarium euwallaceae]
MSNHSNRMAVSQQKKEHQTWQDYTVVLRWMWTWHKEAPIMNSYENTDLGSFSIKLRSHFSELFFKRNLNECVFVGYKTFLSEGQGDPAEFVDLRGNLKEAKSMSEVRGVPNLDHETRSRHRRQCSALPVADPDDSEDNRGTMGFNTAIKTQEINDPLFPDLNTLDRSSGVVEESFKDDFHLLFPASVPAFGLKKKKWTAFNALQLEKATTHLIQALVKGHRESSSFGDVVSGKGQGLLFLLHGVADYLERPLFSISSGELSTDVEDLEETLEAVLTLTKRWDAVCLLDEADVLLCKRNSAEMDRNAIVAVFLRKIEYFQGVLFLTTNRKQDFDEAFKSRIHATISYGDLSDEAQAMIWERLIAANKDVRVDDSWTPSTFSALGKLRFNGRTIKNILRTAVAYANADDEALGLRHVLAMVQTELKDVDDELSVDTESLESAQRDQVKAALDDLQRLLSKKPSVEVL